MSKNQALKCDIEFLKKEKRQFLNALLVKGKQVEQLIELCIKCAMNLSPEDAYYVKSEIDRINQMEVAEWK